MVVRAYSHKPSKAVNAADWLHASCCLTRPGLLTHSFLLPPQGWRKRKNKGKGNGERWRSGGVGMRKMEEGGRNRENGKTRGGLEGLGRWWFAWLRVLSLLPSDITEQCTLKALNIFTLTSCFSTYTHTPIQLTAWKESVFDYCRLFPLLPFFSLCFTGGASGGAGVSAG